MADGTVIIKIKADGKDVEVELEKVQDKISETANAAKDASEDSERDLAAMGVALAAIVASLTAAGLKAYELSSQFDAAFAKTKTVMDENAESAGEMRNAILDLSRDSAMAAGDVSEAVYQAISGSVDTADAVAFVDRANRLAVAGFTSLTNATDVLTTALNAYHLEAGRVEGVSNVLIRTQNLGKTSVDELAASMGKAIATGSAYDVNLQNLSAAYVELTRNGISTAESTTYINAMINELGDSGKAVGKILREQTGKSFGQLMQEGKSLGDVLQILLATVDGNTEALMGLWGSAEAGKAANAIASQSIEDFNLVLAQMNDEMAGTTGTTEQAYETMTSTSEFIDRRFRNSLQNLAIAYGDVLAPPMDLVKGLGADILEGTTDLIRGSPAAAAAISAVSTGVVVLAGGLTTLMIVKKVKEAFGGFNALLAESPWVLAIAGASALAMGIASLVSATREENQYLSEFNGRLEELRGGLDNALAASEVNAGQAQRYADRLEELDAVGTKTTQQQQEYHEILVKLTELIPELTEIIDLENDVIQGGTKALLANTDAWKENAKAQAYQEYLADLEAARTQALIDQAVAEKRLEEARESGKAAIDAYAAALRDAAAASEDADAGALGAYLSLRDLETASMEAHAAIRAAEEQLVSSTTAAELAAAEYHVAKDAIDGLTEAEQDNASAARDAGAALGTELPRGLGAVEAAIPPVQAQLQAFRDQYGALYEAARESLEKQFKLWEQAEIVTATSVETANAGIQSQIDYWKRYNEDLNAIREASIEGLEELYQFISDGSTESVAMAAGIAEAIREGNEPAVEDMVDLYRDLKNAQGDTAEAMLAMQNDMDQALDDLVEATEAAVNAMSLPEAAYAAARETIAGYVRGLYRGEADVAAAAWSAARAYTQNLHSTGGGGAIATAYASGTGSAAPGLALVGEEGPELIWLRGGERIMTAEETREALGAMYPVTDTASYTEATAPAAVGGNPGGKQQMTIVVPVEIDGRELARVTAQAMGEEMMFGGY